MHAQLDTSFKQGPSLHPSHILWAGESLPCLVLLPSKCSPLLSSALSLHSDQTLWYHLTISNASFILCLNLLQMVFGHLPSVGTAQRSSNPCPSPKPQGTFPPCFCNPASSDLADHSSLLEPLLLLASASPVRSTLLPPPFFYTCFSAPLPSSPPPINVGISESLCLCSFLFPMPHSPCLFFP